MTISTITGITQEGQPQELSSFLRSGVVYVMWHTPISLGLKRLCWKPHDGLNFTEIIPALGMSFRNVAALYDPTSDHVVVVWDDGAAADTLTSGTLYSARFNPITGTLISGPTTLFAGSNAKLSYHSTTQNSNWLLYYRTAKNIGVYGRGSRDGGLTWDPAYPLYTGQTRVTAAIDAVPYSSSHASVAQLGSEARPVTEIASLRRTRPLTAIVKHPTVANQFFIGEPSKFDNVTLTDNLRGGLVASTDGTKLYHLDGVAQGTSDTVGAVALISASGMAVFSILASAGPTGNGDDVVEYSLVPALGALNVDLPGTSYAVGLDVSSTHAYVAEYADNSGAAGQFVVVDLSSGSTGTVLSGVTGVRAVAVANFLLTPLIFVATTESGVERLRVYQQNGLTPTLLLNVKLTSRANFLTVALDPTQVNGVLVYASLVDRLNIYRWASASVPIQLVDSLTLPGGGSFFQSKVAANGNIVVAVGNAGVLVLSSDGKILSQSLASGESILYWAPSTVYPLNALVRPRETHQFARSRYYFKATTGGTSGNSEPSWASAGTVIDSTAQWQAVGLLDGVAVGIELDETNKRIYAAGSAGGILGTDGRVWMFSAVGLL